jgi:cytochrome c oxidase accessory protein FixG
VKENAGENKDSFRDHIATIRNDGKRNYIHPLKPKGRLYRLRSITSTVYLVVFLLLPFIKHDGEPLFLFNILERKFILFGVIFWPTDFIIFGIGMITFIVFIVLFTVVFGRVFCGWACPQTILMEMVFRKIEYFFEGDSNEQIRLAKMNWNAEKIRKRGMKLFVFAIISFILANFFLSYIIGMNEILDIYRAGTSTSGSLTAVIIFAGIFFGLFSWFREQACLIVCPYGRLQGVLLDRNSIVVAYDYQRGEPRGHISKKEKEKQLGDCVDCSLCVKVCPTGIDIRNGTQMECVNCTACIDACDEVMEKVHRPKGLIRYASEEGIKNKQPLTITRRIKAYSFVLALLVGVLVFLLATRSDIDATVLRAGGQLFEERPGDSICNLYTVSVINKTRKDMPLSFRLDSNDGTIQMVGKPVVVPKEGKAESELFIIKPKSTLTSRKTKVKVSVYSGNKLIQTVSTNFLGPISR